MSYKVELAVVEALRGLLLCVEGYTDADLSAQGMKRTSQCIVQARLALGDWDDWYESAAAPSSKKASA